MEVLRRHFRQVGQRPRFLGIDPDQQRHVVVASGGEDVRGRLGQDAGFDDRMDQPVGAAIAQEALDRQAPQLRQRRRPEGLAIGETVGLGVLQ